MNSKLFGSVLLIIGTTIGAGMLALPIATAQIGFWYSSSLLIACWAIMTISAFIFLEVNLWLPANSNLISMTERTLGNTAQSIVWLIYLTLQYSILCAYISGGADIFHYFILTMGISISLKVSAVIFTCLFGYIVYGGIRFVDYFNRVLMFSKLGSLLFLIICLMPFVFTSNLGNNAIHEVNLPSSLSILAVAFATIVIIPSLRTYFGDDIKSLRYAIFFGTLIPLVLYIAWNFVILGSIPLNGDHGMKQIIHSSNPTSDLIITVNALLKSNLVTILTKIFTSICMATSFLSISLSLSDFWADGMSVKKEGKEKLVIFAITFLPPLMIVLFYPGIFIHCLKYAGICCFILMIFLPPVMAWRGRYGQYLKGYRIPGGKFLLAFLMIFGIGMIGLGVSNV